MEDQTLLTELCSSCNILQPKYRCPRCSSRTCSLPCYKRHQKRACCSGKRDQAAYLPRSKLATPAGIDHDYNFLNAIQRDILQPRQPLSLGGRFLRQQHRKCDANTSRRERGFVGRRDGRSATSRQPTDPAPASNLKKRLDACRVIVERLPAGMSRQLENRTRWHQKRKKLFWTLEWIHPDGSRDLRNCPEDMPMREAYNQLISQRSDSPVKAQKRAHGVIESAIRNPTPPACQSMVGDIIISKVMTDVAENTNLTAVGPPNQDADQMPNEVEQKVTAHVYNTHDHKDSDTNLDIVSPSRQCSSPSDECLIKLPPLTASINPSTELNPSSQQPISSPSQPATTTQDTELHQENQARSARSLESSNVAATTSKSVISNDDIYAEDKRNEPCSRFRFFLRHPHTRGHTRVLIPLSPTDCLADALRGQVVLEFPTVQVFPTHESYVDGHNKHTNPISTMKDKVGNGVDAATTSAMVAAQDGSSEGNDNKYGKGGIIEHYPVREGLDNLNSDVELDNGIWSLPEGFVVASRV